MSGQSPFRVVGSQNLTADSLGQLNLGLSSAGILGRGGPASGVVSGVSQRAAKSVVTALDVGHGEDDPGALPTRPATTSKIVVDAAARGIKTTSNAAKGAAPPSRAPVVSDSPSASGGSTPGPRRGRGKSPRSRAKADSRQGWRHVTPSRKRGKHTGGPRAISGSFTGPQRAQISGARAASSVVAKNNALVGTTRSSKTVGVQRPALSRVTRAVSAATHRFGQAVRGAQLGAAAASSPLGWIFGVGGAIVLVVVMAAGLLSGVGSAGSGGGGVCLDDFETGGAASTTVVSRENLAPHVAAYADHIGEMFKLDTIGGYRPYDPIADDHPSGLALDIMVPNFAVGDAVAQYLIANESAFEPVYMIWKQRYYNFPYGGRLSPGNWVGMADRGSPTQNHMDHVHVLFKENPGNLEWSPELCIGTELSADGWARPSSGPLTSHFGQRFHPILHTWKLHEGTDFAQGCGSPIYAAQSGVVKTAGMVGGTGTILIDHGGGVETRYLHMYPDGILVRAGQTVEAGALIGREGATGYATGCHLHFEVYVGGQLTDPLPFLAARGISG